MTSGGPYSRPARNDGGMKIGVYVFAIATIAAGVVNLVWHDFSTDYQPIQAFGDRIEGREAFAIVCAIALCVGGLAILRRRSAAAGATVLVVTYLAFAWFWTPRLYTVPHVLGFRIAPIVGVLDGLCQQLVLVVAAAIVYACATAARPGLPRFAAVALVAFGACCIVFGLEHFVNVAGVAPLVPRWLPPGGGFWTIVTGSGFVLAGVAIVSRVLDVLAARLLTAMLLVFSALVLLPQIVAYPHVQAAWSANTYNLTAAGAAWIVAAFLAIRAKAEAEVP